MCKKSIKQLNQGTMFRLVDSDKAPVWVRGEFNKFAQKYECYKYEDVNKTREISGGVKVFVGFTY